MMNAKSYLYPVCMFALVAVLVTPILSYANVASASNASGSDDYDDDIIDDIIEIENDLVDPDMDTEELSQDQLLKEILSNVQDISASLASSSNAQLPDMEDSSEDEETYDFIDDFSIGPLAINAMPDHDVVNIVGRFGGTRYTLVVPRQYYANLWVSDSGILYNLSASNITCRMFTGTTFNDADYNYNLLTLTPMLGNSANNLYRYGSLSYRTYYYHSSGSSLTSTNTYGNFTVESIDIQRSLDVDYRIYYVLVVLLFMEGLILLCSWKNYRR